MDKESEPQTDPKRKFIGSPKSFSRSQILVFALVFAAIGGYVLYRSFAATPLIAGVEGESMTVQSTSTTSSAAVAVPSTAIAVSAKAVTTAPATPAAAPTAKPVAPTGLKATAANGSVVLSWNANPGSNQVNSYQVYYGTVASFSSFNGYVPSVTATTYTVTGLTNGKTYYFRISAHNSVGYGPWNTPPVSSVPVSGGGSTTSAKPGIPSGLTATAANGSVVLNWNANPASDQVNNYQVYYDASSGFANSTFINNVTATTYTVTGLTNGTIYYFKVSAHNSAGYGAWSANSVSATPAGSVSAKPGIPSGLTATASNGSVTLNWAANPASDQVNTYQVYYGTVSSFSSFSTFIDNIPATTYTVTGLTNGTTYYFKVSAHNSVGYGPWSASPVGATPTTSTTNPPPPTVSQVVSDSSASAGKEMELLTNATLSSSFSLSSAVNSLIVMAKATVCSGTGAAMVVSIDGTQVLSTTVSATSLTSYSANVNLAAGSHTLTIGYTNDSTTSTCDRNLFVDVTDFYGPNVTTPAPVINLTANPTSVTSGSTSTLSWSTTNATTCTASWASGNQALNSSFTTSALTATTTYTLNCTGSGGSASKSATVTVTPASGGGGSGSGFVPHAMYDSDGTQPNFTTDWPGIAATGINTLILPSEWISNLQTLAAAGDKAWVTAGHWTDSTASFSLSQSQAVADVTAACATGVVQGIYVADEPDESLSSTPAADIAAVKARALALKAACPGAVTIMAYWDSTTIAQWKGVTDIIALDGYPSRDGFNNSVITQQAAAADAAGIKYYGVIGAFTDGTSNYPLPTAAQLSSMFSAWESTNELGWAVYSWGAAGGATSTQLQNQPSLLSVIKSNAAL